VTAPISAEHERELVARWQRGDRDAGAALLAANESLLGKLVGSRAHPSRREDAMQDARLGFLRAAQRYDPSEGPRLATYASKWARGESLKATYEDTTIAVKSTAVARARRVARSGELPRKRALTMRLRSTRSLDEPINDIGETLRDVLAGESPSPEALIDHVDADARRETIASHVLGALADRERDIVRRYYMSDERPTLREIANDAGVCHERVSQLLNESMLKLRRAVRAVMTEDDRLLGSRRPSKPVDGWLDDHTIIVLRALRRAGSATAKDLTAASRGQVSETRTYKVLKEAEKRGVVQFKIQPGSTALPARHYSLTDHGRTVLDSATNSRGSKAA
jgi:RNA polymerase sigma-32 factor